MLWHFAVEISNILSYISKSKCKFTFVDANFMNVDILEINNVGYKKKTGVS